MARGDEAFNIRLPPGMRDRIKLAADRNGRSMNAEIVHTLQSAYPGLTPDKVSGLRKYLQVADRYRANKAVRSMISEIQTIVDSNTALSDEDFQRLLIRSLSAFDQAISTQKSDAED